MVKKWKNLSNLFLENKALITIEASLVSMIFLSGYLILNSVAMGLITESITRKALFEMGMDVSAYLQVVDKIDKSNDISNQKDYFETYKEEIIEKLDSEFNFNNILNTIFKLTKKNLRSSIKTEVYNNAFLPLFYNKLNSINSYYRLSEYNIKNKIKNIRFENTHIYQNGNLLELNLKYSYSPDVFGLLSLKNNVNQKVVIDNWVDRKNNKLPFNTIWYKSNFERGWYFADLIRSNTDIPLKGGTGFDYYDESTNSLTQVISLNVFASHYSEKIGDKYIISNNFNEQIKIYMNKVIENYKKYKDKIYSKSGELMSIDNPKLKLKIIMPEEAKRMTNIKEIIKNLENKTELEFKYLEKVFNDS